MTADDNPDARVVRVEIEVPATPEQVWAAIATGPGIACWFVPAEVDGREGGAITTHHGPYGDSSGVVTAWQPPHRFAYEERPWEEPGAPPWATEILVEARAGGTCIVRLASGVFSGGQDWGDEIAGTEAGWTQGLENLRVYLTHFAGLRCTPLLVVGTTDPPQDRAWTTLLTDLGLAQAAVGQRASTASGAPPTAGIVEGRLEDAIMLRIDAPAPGIVEAHANTWGDRVHLSLRAYLYGDAAPAAAARAESAWREWMTRRAEVLDPGAFGHPEEVHR